MTREKLGRNHPSVDCKEVPLKDVPDFIERGVEEVLLLATHVVSLVLESVAERMDESEQLRLVHLDDPRYTTATGQVGVGRGKREV